MPTLTRTQLIILIGFIVVVISIPLSLLLLKNAQVFKSRATENVKKKTSTTSEKVASKETSTPLEIPVTSPLAELQKLLEGTSSATGTPTPTPAAVNLAFGPTLNTKIILEGRPKDKYKAKVFLGLSQGTASAIPKYLLTFTVDFPDSGIFQGLSLAGLNPGSIYTAYIKGPAQIDSASTFTMSPTESTLNNNQPLTLFSGDLNEDNTINSTDYTIIKSLYGSNKGSPKWNERADFNIDGVINNLDLAYVLKNFGKTGASGTWYSPIPTTSSSATPTATKSGSPSGGYWLWVP